MHSRENRNLARSTNKALGILVLMLAAAFTALAPAVRAGELLLPSDMVYIGQGESVMGLDTERPVETGKKPSAYDKRMNRPWSADAFHDESPAHAVFLDSYLMDKYEVSNEKYKIFMGAQGHPAPAYWDDPRLNRPEQPVVGVNWSDARAFCEFHGKRLPTEAEWEKAARGPKGNLYPWGNEFDPMKVNFGKHHDTTMPVDSYPDGVSYYGLHNMAGNVFEWVSDWYDPRYYGTGEARQNPRGPSKPVWLGGTGTYVDRLTVGNKRVIRGGSWIAVEGTARTTHRFWNNPMNNSYGVGLGFRCAKDAPRELDQRIKESAVATLIALGREQFEAARQALAQGLALDPKNVELLQLQVVINRSEKRP